MYLIFVELTRFQSHVLLKVKYDIENYIIQKVKIHNLK